MVRGRHMRTVVEVHAVMPLCLTSELKLVPAHAGQSRASLTSWVPQLQHFNLANPEVKGFQCRIHREPALAVRAASA